MQDSKPAKLPSHSELNELERLHGSIPVLGYYPSGAKMLDWNSQYASQLVTKLQELVDKGHSLIALTKNMHSSVRQKVFRISPNTPERFEAEKLAKAAEKLPLRGSGRKQNMRNWSTPEGEQVVYRAAQLIADYDLAIADITTILGIGTANWYKLCDQYGVQRHIKKEPIEIGEREVLRVLESYSGPLDQKELAKHIAKELTSSIQEKHDIAES